MYRALSIDRDGVGGFYHRDGAERKEVVVDRHAVEFLTRDSERLKERGWIVTYGWQTWIFMIANLTKRLNILMFVDGL